MSNTKQKTALQKVIDNYLMRDLTYWKLELHNANQSDNFYAQARATNFVESLTKLINEVKSLLPEERQNIIDAYSAAGHEYYDKSFNESTSVAWFNKTYGHEKADDSIKD